MFASKLFFQLLAWSKRDIQNALQINHNTKIHISNHVRHAWWFQVSIDNDATQNGWLKSEISIRSISLLSFITFRFITSLLKGQTGLKTCSFGPWGLTLSNAHSTLQLESPFFLKLDLLRTCKKVKVSSASTLDYIQSRFLPTSRPNSTQPKKPGSIFCLFM